jgi:hypothetical protein
MFSADLNISRSDRGRAIIPVIFFLSPLVASAVPRLTWLFLPLIATALIVPVLRRGGEWRQLIQPNTALVAVLLVVLYVFFNATWAADRGVAFGKAALLLGVLLITFAASRAIALGVILIALAGAAVALRMSLLPAEAQPFAAATFVAFWAIAAFGWGMWQTWLMCAVGLMLVYLGIAARASGGAPEH